MVPDVLNFAILKFVVTAFVCLVLLLYVAVNIVSQSTAMIITGRSVP